MTTEPSKVNSVKVFDLDQYREDKAEKQGWEAARKGDCDNPYEGKKESESAAKAWNNGFLDGCFDN